MLCQGACATTRYSCKATCKSAQRTAQMNAAQQKFNNTATSLSQSAQGAQKALSTHIAVANAPLNAASTNASKAMACSSMYTECSSGCASDPPSLEQCTKSCQNANTKCLTDSGQSVATPIVVSTVAPAVVSTDLGVAETGNTGSEQQRSHANELYSRCAYVAVMLAFFAVA